MTYNRLIIGPPLVCLPHASTTRPKARQPRLCGIFEEDSIFRLHSLPGSARKQAVNFLVLVPGKLDLTALDERLELLAVQVGVRDHVAS
jgi:hypothetical protein